MKRIFELEQAVCEHDASPAGIREAHQYIKKFIAPKNKTSPNDIDNIKDLSL